MIYFQEVSREKYSYPPCEAPVHNDRCDGVGSTVDHFTPECIARLFGWTREQINAEENLQHLSKPCHCDKDKTTEARLTLARKQLRGAYISLEYYLSINEPGFNLEKARPKKRLNVHRRNEKGDIRRTGRTAKR
jgi:hypothetical protein